jgi:hypothetical protein
MKDLLKRFLAPIRFGPIVEQKKCFKMQFQLSSEATRSD